jgi:hypothetical protein
LTEKRPVAPEQVLLRARGAHEVELRGPIRILLLLLTGRTATALPHLSGPGVHTITERFVIPRSEADQS